MGYEILGEGFDHTSASKLPLLGGSGDTRPSSPVLGAHPSPVLEPRRRADTGAGPGCARLAGRSTASSGGEHPPDNRP